MNKHSKKINVISYLFLYFFFSAYYLMKGDYGSSNKAIGMISICVVFVLTSILNLFVMYAIAIDVNTYKVIVMIFCVSSFFLAKKIIKPYIKKRYVQRFVFLKKQEGKLFMLICGVVFCILTVAFTGKNINLIGR